MNVKKAVYDDIIKTLNEKLENVKGRIYRNTFELNKLRDTQILLKRERAALDRLIRKIKEDSIQELSYPTKKPVKLGPQLPEHKKKSKTIVIRRLKDQED